MALGDLMASRFSQSSVLVVPNHHLDDSAATTASSSSSAAAANDDADFAAVPHRRDSEHAVASSSTTSAYANAATTMAYLPQTVVLCELRHDAFEVAVPAGPSDSGLVSKWRPKDRMKTGCVALVLCLNISVDPPDVIKISPCARMECWIDPFSMAPQKALESIGKSLSSQYERWQPKARYKCQLDPTVDEVKKLCTTCRRYAKSERVLFHYNEHGVPKPTENGEIWVFNKSYTLPISDLDSWLKTPSIYVFDCSAAGMIVNSFIEGAKSQAQDHEKGERTRRRKTSESKKKVRRGRTEKKEKRRDQRRDEEERTCEATRKPKLNIV